MKLLTRDEIQIIQHAISSLIEQRSSFDADSGTDNALIDQAQTILDNESH